MLSQPRLALWLLDFQTRQGLTASVFTCFAIFGSHMLATPASRFAVGEVVWGAFRPESSFEKGVVERLDGRKNTLLQVKVLVLEHRRSCQCQRV